MQFQDYHWTANLSFSALNSIEGNLSAYWQEPEMSYRKIDTLAQRMSAGGPRTILNGLGSFEDTRPSLAVWLKVRREMITLLYKPDEKYDATRERVLGMGKTETIGYVKYIAFVLSQQLQIEQSQIEGYVALVLGTVVKFGADAFQEVAQDEAFTQLVEGMEIPQPSDLAMAKYMQDALENLKL